MAREERRPKLIHYHLMQLAAEIRRANQREPHPERVKMLDFSLSRDDNDDTNTRATTGSSSKENLPTVRRMASMPEAPKLTAEEVEHRAAISRSRWGTALSLSRGGNAPLPASKPSPGSQGREG